MKEITLSQAEQSAKAAGFETLLVKGGASPFASFDLLVFTAGHTLDIPSSWDVSTVTLVSSDPATAYKGRVGRGRLILIRPQDGGWVTVSSNEIVKLTLADGTPIGHKTTVAFGDLFGGLEL